MKPEQLYQQLKELAEKLDIAVREQNLRNTPGIKAKSGLCRVKEQNIFIMDKHHSLRDKLDILAECLSQFSIDEIYLVPAVRELLEKNKAKIKEKEEQVDE